MEIDIANIISAAGTLLAAYFAYNQYTKNKLTDLKWNILKKKRKEEVTTAARTPPRCSVSCGVYFMKRKQTGYISYNPIPWGI